jgi:hypothetical protein
MSCRPCCTGSGPPVPLPADRRCAGSAPGRQGGGRVDC